MAVPATPMTPPSTAGDSEPRSSRWWRLLWGVSIVYIAAIGVFAIEELQRREDSRSVLKARASEVAAALVALRHAEEAVDTKREELERELAKLHELERRLTALIVSGSVRTEGGPDGTVRQLMCELTTLVSPSARCVDARGGVRDVFGYVVLKRPAERTASGDILAVLVVVAALGGSLVRLYLPNAEPRDAFRSVMQGIGGGVVCYLAIAGQTLVPSEIGLATVKTPATASLLGFLSGMFATRVFELISNIVDSWMKRLTPAKEEGMVVKPPEQA